MAVTHHHLHHGHHGHHGHQDIKKLKWFRGLNWAALYNKQLEPYMVPEFDSPMDTRQYDKYADSAEESGPLLQPTQDAELFSNW